MAVIHDETVDRTTDATGPVNEYTLEELRSLDAGDGEYVPSLTEVLTTLRDADEIRMEIKEPETAEAAYETAKHCGVDDKTVVHSFAPDTFDRLPDEVMTSSTAYSPLKAYTIAKQYGCEIITPHYDRVSEQFIKAAQDEGYKVDLWGIDSKDAFEDAVRLDPDYIGVEERYDTVTH